MNEQSHKVDRALGNDEVREGTDRSNDLIELVYEAARHRRSWQNVLREIAHSFQSVSGFIARQDLTTSSCRVLFDHGLTSGVINDHEIPICEVTGRISSVVRGHLPEDLKCNNKIPKKTKLIIAEELEEIELPTGTKKILLGATSISKTTIEYICLVRNVGAEQFRSEDVDRLSGLLPHIRQALTIFHELSEGRYVEQGAMLALNYLPYATIIVSRDGWPIAKNAYGEELIDSGEGIWVGPNGLELTPNGTTESVKQLLDQRRKGMASQPRTGWDAQPLLVERESGELPLCVLIFPLGDGHDTVADEPGGLVLIADPERRNPANIALVRRAFGLTPAEARVAEFIANGGRVSDAPRALGISVATARTHLRRVFSKTGTVSQADLVRLANCYAAP